MSEIGEIVGRIRLDTSAWDRSIAGVQAEVRELAGTDTTVDVRTTGTAKAVAELDAVKRAEDRVSDSSAASARAQGQARDELGRFSKAASGAAAAENELDGANRRTSKSSTAFSGEARRQADALAVLVKVAIAAAPALIPVAAATVGLAGGLGGLGAAGLLAGTGIARGLKEGTAAAEGYRPLISRLREDLHRLQDTAAAGLLPGAQDAVDRLDAAMPSLSRETALFAHQLGDITPTAVDAVVTALERAEPLFAAGGTMLGRWVQALDDGAHSDQFESFVQYALANLPEVEQLLSDALRFAGDFLSTMAPYAGVMLHVADGVLKVGDALTPIAPALWATWTAWQAWKGAGAIIDLLRGKLVLLGAEAVTTGGKVAAAGGMAGGAGAVGAAGGAGLAARLTGGVALGTALGTGALVAGVTDAGAGTGVQANFLNSLLPLSWRVGDAQTTAATHRGLGNSNGLFAKDDAAYAKASASGDKGAIAAASKTIKSDMAAAGQNGINPTELASVFPKYTKAVQEAAAGTSEYRQAQEQAAKVQRDYAAGTAQFAGEVNVADTAAFRSVTSANAASQAMVDLGSALKSNKGAWSEHTAAGLADRAAVANTISAINAHAVAINADGKHTAEAKLYTDSHILALKDQARQAGVSSNDINGYVATLLGVPKSVVSNITAKTVDAERKAAQAKRYAQDYAKGNYNAILRGNFTPAQKAAATAAKAARDYMSGNYKAALKADPSLANSNIAQVRKNAVQFGGLKPTAALAARNLTQPAIDAAKAAIASIRDKTVNIYVETHQDTFVRTHTGSGKNIFTGGAHGGTVGAADFGRLPRLASGGTITGPGSAASDTAGVYRLASGEEVVSNLTGGAAAFRPLLKAISAGTVRTPTQVAQAVGAPQQAQPQVLQFHFTDDGSMLGTAMRQIAERAMAVQAERNHRFISSGLRPLGL